MKKVALIGVTGYGRTHLRNLTMLAKEKVLDLAAAVVIFPDQAKAELETLKKYGTKIYASADEMFAAERGRIDLVCIPTGIGAHRKLTIQALQAGMNVLVEKPAAGSTAAVKEMIAARKDGLFAAVGFQHCYSPEIHCFKQMLVMQRLGKIVRSCAEGIRSRDDVYYSRNSWAGRRAAPDGEPILDSPANNAFAHYLNVLLFMSGETEFQTAHALSVRGKVLRARPEIEMFDACHAVFTLSNGTEAEIRFAHCTEQTSALKFRIECENGVIEWNGDTGWKITDNQNAVLASGTVANPSPEMFRQAVLKLDHPELPVYTLENALEHTNCIEMLDRSCPIQPVEAVKKDGVYCVPGLMEWFEEKL